MEAAKKTTVRVKVQWRRKGSIGPFTPTGVAWVNVETDDHDGGTFEVSEALRIAEVPPGSEYRILDASRDCIDEGET